MRFFVDSRFAGNVLHGEVTLGRVEEDDFVIVLYQGVIGIYNGNIV